MLKLSEPLQITIPSPAGAKTLKFRYPEDEMMERRQRARSFAVKGNEERYNESPEIDLEIASAIKLEGDDLEAAEATWLLNKLSSADFTDGGRCEGGFFLEVEFLGSTVRHELSIPSAAQLAEFKKKSLATVSGKFGWTTYVTNLKPGRDLYDKLVISNTTADSYVPINIKSAVVSQIARLIEDEVTISNPTASLKIVPSAA